jgi:hypothetical protein
MNKLTSTSADRIADYKTAFAAAAEASRHAAAMGWNPTDDGVLIDVQGDTWGCCALGALALQHKLDSQTEEHSMRDLVLEVEDMPMSETLAGVPGIKHRGWASRRVANTFDRMATTYWRARYGYPLDYTDRRVLEENGIADAEDFAHLSASDFWLLVAKRFEELSR